MRKSVWLLSASLIALPSAAFGQDTSQAPAPTEPSATEQAATEPDSQAVADAEPGEIIVTAQGRRQVLQDVPIAVTAVGAEEMQNSGASDIRQLNQLAPSLLVSSTGSEANGSARIRGIGTVGDNPGLESSVAVFIDGVYRSRSGVGLNELGEIDRVEVLRGPQGTLFGRNTSAGLINIISKRPSYTPEVYGEVTLGNYDLRRFAAGLTGGLAETLAARIDAVYVKRDGFYHDANNDTDVNDRDRFFTRGQLLFEPSDAVSFRLIGDYTTRDEKCCGAVYVNDTMNDDIGNLLVYANPLVQPGSNPPRVNDNANNIINVLTDLGQPLDAYQNPFSREIYVTPGRSYAGKTKDGGLSLEGNFDLGFAKLTSVSGWRYYKAAQGGDLDYSTVDLLYRDANGGSYRKFNTLSQEFRLNGTTFNDRLDWLVGAYYADEDLTIGDELRFGAQYGQFMACRVVSGSFPGFYSPTSTGCLSPTGRAVLSGALAPAIPSPLGSAGPLIVGALDRLNTVNNVGGTGDLYQQNSRNWALFTHNIFHVTPQIDVTVGLRYTNERKRLDAEFHNDNTICPAQQAALAPLLSVPSLASTAAGLITLACVFNSTSELEGVEINDTRKENKLTGTGVLSYKPNDDLMFYASYSRGYKAGGFNLDRTALKVPYLPFSAFPGGAQGLVKNLEFDPETVDAFELGGKYSAGGLLLNFALFRQYFSNFQLNTFDGTVFIVQNINGCKSGLGQLDEDQSKFPTGANYNAAAAATGVCDKEDVSWGVRSQGIEIEAGYRLMRDLRLNAGLTLADTRYREDLVGTDEGAPLNQALRVLPGKRISNAPGLVLTGAIAYTPQITNALSGLFYVDARHSSHYNTGSDLFPQKAQSGFTVVNGRVGVRGPDERWALELWAQNLFNAEYTQVAFNSSFQEGGTTPAFTDPDFPGGRQIFSAYLAEPRTYGLTARFRFSPRRAAPVIAPVELPPPPPPVVQEPVAPEPVAPPPPPSGGERG